MTSIIDTDKLPAGQQIFFASDFHLGAPDPTTSAERERKIVRWLEAIAPQAYHIFLVGDLFDYWYEYRFFVPKGCVRFLGKLAELRDSGIPISFFVGNHDTWMFDYFPNELGIPVYKSAQTLRVGHQRLYLHHGDGLGPGDSLYKVIRKCFHNKLLNFLYSKIHPDLGYRFARAWSSKSRQLNHSKDEVFLGEDEWLWSYCKKMEQHTHHNWYVFGHRHYPMDLPVGPSSRYINLGEWLNHCTYAAWDGQELLLQPFEQQTPVYRQ